jgi:N-acetylmuramoyl-L-alanine amidase
MRWLLSVLVLVFATFGLSAPAQELSALARLDAARSSVTGDDTGLTVTLGLSQPIPWRVRLLDNPPRLVMDFREVDWTGLDAMPRTAPQVKDLRAGVFRPGWSRLVLELSGPFAVQTAAMTTDPATQVQVKLQPTTQAAFANAAATPEPDAWALPSPAQMPVPPKRGDGPLIVVLDPGHGGIDPGAERDGQTESALMLTFARELKETLLRDGNFTVVMTREEDVFVPLETRTSIARAAGAQVFISLHADAIAEGEAVGATIYRLSEDASDEASRALAERHDREDLLSGVDLTEQDDLVATVLMDMARTETDPRINRLTATLQSTLQGAGVKMHRHPIQQADFSVLKSPDIPSVLIEVGFLSSAEDLARLVDPAWRAQFAEAIRAGLATWARDEAALSALRKN